MAETKFGTFEDLLGITEDNLKPIVIRLREIILEVDPNTVEVVRLGEKAATYGVGPKKMMKVTPIFFRIRIGSTWVSIKGLLFRMRVA